MRASIFVVLLVNYVVDATPVASDPDQQIRDVLFDNRKLLNDLKNYQSRYLSRGRGASITSDILTNYLAQRIMSLGKNKGQTTLAPSTLVPGKPTGSSDYCETSQGLEGRCVNSYQCLDGKVNTDGSDLLDEKSSSCIAPQVCCFLTAPNVTTTTTRPSTLVPGVSNNTSSDYCETSQGLEGRCVFSYLCDDGGQVNDDGSDLLDEKSASCNAPRVCCALKSANLNVTTSTERSSTLVPGIPTPPSRDQPCKAFDGSEGRCVFVHLCNGDSINQDGSDILDERGGDSCPSWLGGFQICCPAHGLVLNDNSTATPPTSTTTRNDKASSMKPDEDGPNHCTAEGGIPGECVPFYQCQQEDDDDDGSGIIDTRYQPSPVCHYSKVCCASDNINKSIQPPNKQNTTKCGIANPGGLVYKKFVTDPLEAKFGEFPWVVVVRTKTGPGPDQYNNTGGSLIHPSVVLTAAHYVVRAYKGEVVVRAGAWDLLATHDPLPRQDVPVREIEAHPAFNNRNKQNDIALLFLSRPMELAPHIGVVCLPAPEVRQDPSTDCIASGWGKDQFGSKGRYKSILKKVTLPVVGNEDCQNLLRRTRLGAYYNLHASFMCAGGEGSDTCTGDGGAPLACKDTNERYVQAGIVSWGIECGQRGRPGVNADVAYFRQWIDEKVRAQGLETSVYTL